MTTRQRRGCPYGWCSALVEIVDTGPDPQRPGSHQYGLIKTHAIEHSALTGNCPASLMKVPFTQVEHQVLADRERVDEPTVNRWMQEQGRIAWDQHHQQRRQNQSQPLRGPHRMGREPEPTSPEWALGGRADEDVPPSTGPQSGIEERVPLQYGGVHGRTEGHGMGITEDAANLNNAKTKADEAILAVTGILDLQSKIGEAKHSIDEARASVLIVAGETPGETIQAIIENLRIADEELQRLGTAINNGWTITGALQNMKDKADEFIARLFS